MDNAVLLAFASVAGAALTGAGTVAVAYFANKRETLTAAEQSADQATSQQLAVRDERIILRDERIAELTRQLEDCRKKANRE